MRFINKLSVIPFSNSSAFFFEIKYVLNLMVVNNKKNLVTF